MKPKKQGFPINPNPGPPPIIYCVHCGTALVNSKCPLGHKQEQPKDGGSIVESHVSDPDKTSKCKKCGFWHSFEQACGNALGEAFENRG
jgi:hypothetical protein